MKRLLVVDDNTEYLQFLSSVLSGDFDTIKATGVKDALDILQAITVDAICSDFNMKDGTGLDLLEDIRQRGISVPFLLMSGDDDCLLNDGFFSFAVVRQMIEHYGSGLFSAFIFAIKS